ncbi:BTB/POZ domain-containing protein [Nymphaea thermarum]|nr:BTB/POZ domain-containing protein [Nymphaea thermarum]
MRFLLLPPSPPPPPLPRSNTREFSFLIGEVAAMMRLPLNLGVVETIYEDEEVSNNNSPPSLSPTNSSSASAGPRSTIVAASSAVNGQQPCFPSPSLRRRVHAWCQATGLQTDVVIRVGDRSFDLHKSLLVRRSSYMKLRLSEANHIILKQGLPITPEIFDMIANFCYGAEIAITPFNTAALWCAARFLDMTEEHNGGKANLCQKIESFVSKTILPHRENTLAVLHSSVPLLPRSENLVKRCLEALTAADDCDGVSDWKDDINFLPVDVFFRMMESMRASARNHDTVYTIVKFYIQEHNELTEAEKNQIYGFLDCNRVSLDTLIELVRNPEVPLRLTIHAMFIQQLKARETIQRLTNAERNNNHMGKACTENVGLSLGEILRRDATVREATQLRAEMEATSLRIRDLEADLLCLKREIKERERQPENDTDISRSEKSHEKFLQENKPFSKLVLKGLKTKDDD